MEVRSLERAEPFVTKDSSTIRELLGLPTSALVRNQSLAEATLGSGQATDRHYHRESEEIYLVLDGEIEIKLGDEVHRLGPRDAVLIAADTPRASRNPTDAEAAFAMISVKVSDPMAETVPVEGFWPTG